MKKEQMFARGGQNLKTSSNPYGTKKEMIIAGIFSVLLVALFVVGITYALNIFTGGSDINLIKSGKIAMSYKESSNVINISNALPVTDEVGKNQTDYFDFSISSKADTNADDNDGIKIPYNLIIEPKAVDNDKDALTSEQIKVYLTKIVNGSEKEVIAPTKISKLTAMDTNFKLYSTENLHKNGTGMITTEYRLRAWIDYGVDSSSWNQTSKPKQYKFGINVDATGELGMVVQDDSGANAPVLTENMIPVYYDATQDVWKKVDLYVKDENNPWYNYDEKKWANAVTVSETNRSTYLSAPAGTPIPMDDINAMFVWIPRYKYTYFASNTPTEIQIEFENGTESTGTISCTDAIVANSGKSENCTDTTNGSIIKGTSTYTHPAFTFGDEELTGIWVGKFESSGDLSEITIKPDLEALSSKDALSMFTYVRNMEIVNNIYGFSQMGTTLNNYTGEISGDSNNLDTHMMKNMEWGAVAYLSHSKYGKNSEIFANNSNAWDRYTGRSGGNVGGSTPINGTYPDQTSTSQANDYGFYTYDGYLLNYGTNEKSTTRDLNKVASTTGNIYGIYDMSGGDSEFVMGNMQDGSNVFYACYQDRWSGVNIPLDKYYDKYSYFYNYSEGDESYTRGKLGDATIEMQPTSDRGSWYSDKAVFPKKTVPWFERGWISSLTEAGIFAFNWGGGGSSQGDVTFRAVLSVSAE